MRLVPVSRLYPKENVEIAIDIIDENYQVLLKKGDTLNEENITMLKSTNVSAVYVRDEYCFVEEEKITANPANVLRKVVILRKLSKMSMLGTITKEMVLETLNTVKEIVDSLNEHKDTMKIKYVPKKIMIYDFEERTIYIAIMSSLFALKMGLSKHEASTICLAALVRDIALVQPNVEWGKNHNCKVHPLKSAEWLKKHYKLPQDVLDIVLQHHELSDGTGYPAGLKGDEIVVGARILAIVDAYYKVKTTSITEHTEMNFDKRMKHLDKEYLAQFMKYVTIYEPDTLVGLSSCDIAVVTEAPSPNPFKPQVKIVKSQEYPVGTILDLHKMEYPRIEETVYYID
ncbi:MAG: hypothetical protein ATN35_10850 [Epulopiscium sp. Nele67-Bin004]|nr:MAG: hypothetical protein ATN35_10850 [Epulopiscium sp. Nele67-Bin004]